MKIRKKLKQQLTRPMYVLLAFMMMVSSFPPFTPEGTASAAGATGTVAEWTFNTSHTAGAVAATGGTNSPFASLQVAGGPSFEEASATDRHLKYQGWHNGVNTKYWLASLSTEAFEQITISSQQRSSNSGPKDFKVQISVDNQASWMDVANSAVEVANSYACAPCVLNELPLPAAADNKTQLFIRWVVATNTAVNAVANPGGVGEFGSSYIRDIVIKGVPIDGVEPPVDTEKPAAPANLVGNGLTDTTAGLTWTASTDNIAVKGYNIYRNNAKVGASQTPSYTDTGLAIGTTYNYYVTAFDAANNESDRSNEIQATTKSTAQAVLASWQIANNGEDGVIAATNGVYKEAAALQNVGGIFEAVNTGESAISYQGWDNGENKKYWQVTVPTKGFQNIIVSSEQNSSGSGPRDFKLQMSTNNAEWTDVPNTNLKMSVSNFNCANQACKLKDVPLPSEANQSDLLYLRWIVSSNVNTNGVAGGIGGAGSSRIRDIRISGEMIPGSEIVVPTLDLVKSPKHNAVQVMNDAPVTVKFNKAVKLGAGYPITIIDQNNKAMANVEAQVVGGNQLQLSHPHFTYDHTYTVTIPKEKVSGMDNSPLIRDISWSFKINESPVKPKLFNMTFNGDPRTNMGFAWYTDKKTGSVAEVVEASAVSGNVFPETGAMVFTGFEEEVKTFMVPNDRSTQNKSTFFSHKVIASGLEPGTTYKFRLGNGEAGSWSPIGSFTTDMAEHQDYRFIVGADSQSSSLSGFEPWGDTFRKAADFIGDPKFLIVAGDLVDNGDLESQWQWMFNVAEDSFLKVPYVPVLGGHEVNDYDGDVTTDNDNFYYHFNVPKQVVAGTHPGSVYSFEYGDALYMVFNSQYQGGLAANGKDIDWEDPEFRAQVDWMRNTVAKTDKKWKFVTFHKSPYASGDNSALYEDSRVQFYRQHLTPVFDEMGIDMVFEAHDHMYMRSFQMYGNKVVSKSDIEFDADGNAVNPKGTVYLMPNAMGNKFYQKQQWLHEFDENWNPVIKKDEHGNPIPYDHFFADVNEQPGKKMFTDVSVTEQVLGIKSYTAAAADEGQPGTVGNGLFKYDQYGIKRTDVKPDKAEQVKVEMQGDKAVLTWQAPSDSKEPVRGFRVYEKNDKVSTHWSIYVPVAQGKTAYSYTIEGLNPAKKYDFIVKAVGARINSDPVEVTTMEGPNENEPPSAPTNMTAKAASSFQVQVSWTASAGNVVVSGYDVYRNNMKIGHTPPSVTSFTDSGLKAGATYNYYVKAINSVGIESLASNTAHVKTKDPVAGEGPHKPFPQHPAYAGGSIKPNHITQAEMDATVIRLYKEWKAKYLKSNPYNASQKYVWYTDDLDINDPNDWETENGLTFFPITASEAHGYGMLITALMAGHDPETQADYDALYRYFRAFPSEINPQLMAWRQGDTGNEIKSVSGVDSATDGDLDIAYSLLLADQQWGSQGEINYLAEAKQMIEAIMYSEVYKTDWTLRIADWATSGKYAGATRPSDFMLQHMKDFGTVTGDGGWDSTVAGTYNLINHMYKTYSPNAGLLPDFVIKNGNSFVPATPNWLESDHDGDYYYNSSRVPWRIATDYLVTGDKRAKDQLTTMNKWIREKAGNDPSRIFSGYKLDGSSGLQPSQADEWQDITFIAPFMVSAAIDASNQQWLNDLWDYSAAIDTEEEIYFGNNIRMLSAIVVSGNWWSPTFVDTEAPSAPVVHYANAASSSAIDLKWLAATDNLGVAKYEVYRDGKLIATTNKLEYRDTGLSASKQYAYVVMAYDAAGNASKSSNMRLVTTSSTGGSVTPKDPSEEPKNPSEQELPQFKDIQKHWAEKDIRRAVEKGIIKGYEDETFRPDKGMTRAEFAVILARVFNLRSNGTSFEFKDESKIGLWAKESIAAAVEAGIINGYSDGTFQPGRAITRAEMAAMIARAIGLGTDSSHANGFADDGDIPSWAKGAIDALKELGIVNGRGGNKYIPNGEATRAEAIVIALRLLNLMKAE
ncbi:glycosyl hydrolase family 8 [Paenibacillus sp. GCM10027627]|uniref:glycosyl hydrolase family 8 n=1 Tax=unclassified Paenibacillus TaxID=185978 RepID=UPI00364396D7